MIRKITFEDEERHHQITFFRYDDFYVWLMSMLNEDEKCLFSLFLAEAHEMDRKCERINKLEFRAAEGFTFMMGQIKIAERTMYKRGLVKSLVGSDCKTELTVYKVKKGSVSKQMNKRPRVKSEIPGFELTPSLLYGPQMRIYLDLFSR